MHPPHAYDDVDDFDDELPELPIPRPGEERATAPSAAPISPPKLGGGASFTAGGDDHALVIDTDPDADDRARREELESTRFTWELAARLTQGMLANPGRQNVTVKDAMGIFDQVLGEMQSYARISGGVQPEPRVRPEVTPRAEHGEYFQQAAKAAAPRPARILEPRPDPTITPAITTTPDAAMLPKQQPQQPRPPASYQPLPPGSRYVPGSMAGPPPDPEHGLDRSDEHAA